MEDISKRVTDQDYSTALYRFSNGAGSGIAFNFSLTDGNGDTVNYSTFKNKVVVLDFWVTGCGSCMDLYKKHLSVVEEHYRKNSDVVFISISIDRNRNQWLKSVESGKYTSIHAINLYTTGYGSGHQIIEYYSIKGYPTIVLIGKGGKVLKNNTLDLRDKASAIRL